MTYLQAVILGLIQGLTEFLPVSSSGHLVIFQNFFGFTEPLIQFDVMLHLGTIIAVLVAFWQEIIRLLRFPWRHDFWVVIVACIPVGIFGFFLDDYVSALFSSTIAVGIALLVTGLLMFLSDRMTGYKKWKDITYKNALIIGLCQGCAIIPGLSRSGSTIFGALLCHLDRNTAARFSFIMSVPVILAAAGKSFVEAFSESGGVGIVPQYFVGMLVAAVTGWFAIRFFIRLLEKANMKYFAYYCWLVGVALLVKVIFF